MSQGTAATKPSLAARMSIPASKLSLQDLIAAQGVGPMADPEHLFGTWPGDPADGFEAAVDDLRHQSPERP